jgi:hypothetical protein
MSILGDAGMEQPHTSAGVFRRRQRSLLRGADNAAGGALDGWGRSEWRPRARFQLSEERRGQIEELLVSPVRMNLERTRTCWL